MDVGLPVASWGGFTNRCARWWVQGGAGAAVGTALCLMLLVVGMRWVQGPEAPLGMLEAGETLTVVVEPGDTYWSLAAKLAPESDPRPLVAELRRQVGTPALRPGQRLVLSGTGEGSTLAAAAPAPDTPDAPDTAGPWDPPHVGVPEAPVAP